MTRIWALFAGKRQSRIHPVVPRKNLRPASPFPVDFAPRTDCLHHIKPPAPPTPPTCAVTRAGRKTNPDPLTQKKHVKQQVEWEIPKDSPRTCRLFRRRRGSGKNNVLLIIVLYEMSTKDIHISKWPIILYYLGVFILVPHRTCQFPFQTEDFWWLGVIPASIGMIGIFSSGIHDGRRTSWLIFLAGILGVALSFIPWRHAIL
jgi:hypothetical protein